MRWLALCALVACQGAKSAERQESFGQEVQSRRDEGAWTRETWEWSGEPKAADKVDQGAQPLGGSGVPIRRPDQLGKQDGSGSAASLELGSLLHGPLLRHTLETHAPVVTVSESKTEAATEGHSASSYRFGFSPWQWAIGAAVLAALAYAAFRLKAKLGL